MEFSGNPEWDTANDEKKWAVRAHITMLIILYKVDFFIDIYFWSL